MKAVPVKVDTNTLSVDEFNKGSSQELQNTVLESGQALTESDLTQLGKAMAIYAAGGDYYTDGGAVNAYVLTVVGSKKSPPALFDGMKLKFVAGNTNTGASTVNPAGLGPTAIEENGVALIAGRVVAGEIIELSYIDANSSFELVNAFPGIDDQATGVEMVVTDAGVEMVTGAFFGGTAPDNLLDDHQIPVLFTVEVADADVGGNLATGNFTGWESWIGDRVIIQLFLQNIDTTGMTGSNDLFIRGFTHASDANIDINGVVSCDLVTFTGFLVASIDGGTSFLRLLDMTSGAVDDRIQVQDLVSPTADIFVTISYPKA